MKYIVVLGDGMADYPLAELQNRTPLQAAAIPVIDSLADRGIIGLVKTVPDGMAPGSDTANLSVLGYDPVKYYSGRSSFEAAAMGVVLQEGDISFRCNLVTLSSEEKYADRFMQDYCAGEISSAEAAELIREVNKHLGSSEISFYPGISYRHLMVWSGGPEGWSLTPPHDIIGQRIAPYLPSGPLGGMVKHMMEQSADFLPGHPVNRRRVERGVNPANSIWIWGEGKKPGLPAFSDKYGLKGAVIAAVDLIKGIGKYAGLEIINVPGATGNIDTNYAGKAEAAWKALQDGYDFVFIHIEAPDECSHRFEFKNKVKAIEMIDSKIVKTLKENLDRSGLDYKMMVLPDHATPLSLRTHAVDPVPFLIYHKGGELPASGRTFDEGCAGRSGLYLEDGCMLMDYFTGAAPLPVK